MAAKYEMKDSGVEWIGTVRKEWTVKKLKYLVDCQDGKRVPIDAALRVPGPYPYWGAGTIMDYVDNYIFDEELVLLGEDGAPFFDNTRNVAHRVSGKVWVNNHIHVLKPKGIDASFLTHFLNIVNYRSYINGSILNKLTQSNMNQILVAVPSIPEQTAIASYLDDKCSAIDDVIAQAKGTIEEYKSWKASVIFEAVTKGLDPNVEMKDSGVEWIGSVPVHWEVKALKYLATCNDEVLPETTPGNFLFDYIDIGSVHTSNGIETCERMQFKDAPSRARRIVRSGDIIVSTVRTYLKAIAQVGTFDTPQIASTGFAVIRAKNASAGFLCYALLSDNFVSQVEAESVGISYPAINSSQLMTFKITLPPCEKEQTAIASYLDDKCSAIDSIIFEKQVLIDELESYKKSLIFETVTGKRRVC